jgi:pimeloyl-ACP methyl ester carboxylesterase
LAARVAEPLFFRPVKFPIPEREKEFRSTSESGKGELSSGRIHWFKKGGSGPKILFMHGWSGRGSQFTKMMDAFVEAGFEVYTFDAPGHGDEWLPRIDMLSFIGGIHWMENKFGPFAGAIGHSIGGMALWNAIRERAAIKRLVEIGSPSSLTGVLEDFVAVLNARPAVAEILMGKLSADYQVAEDLFDPVRIAGLHPDVDGLLIHDAQDDEVPLAHALEMERAWKNGRLVTTEGLGHRKLLRDPGVIQLCLDFFANRSGAARVKKA